MGDETMTDLVGAACKDWVTGYGTNTRKMVAEVFDETTDQELSADMLDGWFSEPDPHNEIYAGDKPDLEQAAAAFAELRADLNWLDDWNLPK